MRGASDRKLEPQFPVTPRSDAVNLAGDFVGDLCWRKKRVLLFDLSLRIGFLWKVPPHHVEYPPAIDASLQQCRGNDWSIQQRTPTRHVSIAQVAHFGVDPGTVRKWIKTGHLRVRSLFTLFSVSPGTLCLRISRASPFRFAPSGSPTAWPRQSGTGNSSAALASAPRKRA